MTDMTAPPGTKTARAAAPSRLIKAAGYSLAGLSAAYRHEAAFRFEVWMTAVLIPIALWLGPDTVSIALMIACVMLVMIVELGNSAIEAVVDRISTERHPLSGRAKDLGSAAVFVALVNLVLVWGLLLARAYG